MDELKIFGIMNQILQNTETELFKPIKLGLFWKNRDVQNP